MKANKCFVTLLFSVFSLSCMVVKAETYSSQPIRADYYNRLTYLPQYYENVKDWGVHLGDAGTNADRHDVLELSKSAKTSRNIGQAWLNKVFTIHDTIDFTFYVSLDPTTWNNNVQFSLSGNSDVVKNGKFQLKAGEEPVNLKNALTAVISKNNESDATSGMNVDFISYNHEGERLSFEKVGDSVKQSVAYVPAHNGIFSNSVYYQDAYKLYLPKELRGYGKYTLDENVKDEFGNSKKLKLSIDSLYDQKVLGQGDVGTSKGSYRKARMHYSFADGKGTLMIYVYGFVPMKYEASEKDLEEILGGNDFVFGIESQIPVNTDKDGKKIGTRGNHVVVSDMAQIAKTEEGSEKLKKKIRTTDGFLVREPDSFQLKLASIGYQMKYKEEQLSLYIPELPGMDLTITSCDMNGIPRTYEGRRLMASYSTGEEIPYEDISSYNQIPTNSDDDFSLSPIGGLKTSGKLVNGDMQKALRYSPINMNRLYLDKDGNQMISEEEKSDKNNVFPILEGNYLIEQKKQPIGFLKNPTTWLVVIRKNEKTQEIETQIYKRNTDTEKYRIFNTVLSSFNQDAVQKVRGEYPSLPLEDDNKSIDLGKISSKLSDDILTMNAQFVDEKSMASIQGESIWAFYRKELINGEYQFTGSDETVNKWGFSKADSPVGSGMFTITDGKMKFEMLRENNVVGEANVFVLRQMKNSNSKESMNGYFIVRMVNGNERQIPKNDYLIALNVYQSTEGDHDEKMAELEKLDPDYEFTKDENKISSNLVKETLIEFFSRFEDTYGKNYSQLPDIYRVDYTVDITYYPDGKAPLDIQEASPPEKKEIENTDNNLQGVLPYTYNAGITKSSLGDPDYVEKGNVFGSQSAPTEVTTGASRHELYVNLIKPTNSAKEVETPKEKKNYLPIILISIFSVILLGCLVIFGILFFKMKKEKIDLDIQE